MVLYILTRLEMQVKRRVLKDGLYLGALERLNCLGQIGLMKAGCLVGQVIRQ